MKKYFFMLFFALAFLFILVSCSKEEPKNPSQISKPKLKLNQENLTKFKDSLIGPKFIESLKIIGDGKVELIVADDNIVPANSYMPGALECLNPAKLFYNFPDLKVIQLKAIQWYGFKSGSINRQELEKCLGLNFNEPNDSIFNNKIEFGTLNEMFSCSESLFTDNFKDEKSKKEYLKSSKNTESKIESEIKTITMADFENISNGMSLSEVENILGRKGTLSSEAGDGDFKVATYQWIFGEYGENVTVCFVGGEVQSKAQVGLK